MELELPAVTASLIEVLDLVMNHLASIYQADWHFLQDHTVTKMRTWSTKWYRAQEI